MVVRITRETSDAIGTVADTDRLGRSKVLDADARDGGLRFTSFDREQEP
jgi:hypothetical protein